jgi:CBS domain-containing protein
MSLLKIARVPAVTVGPESTVLNAIKKMIEVGVGAVVVVENDELRGIFTERDVLRKVAVQHLPLDTTKVSEVMSSPAQAAHQDLNPSEALSIMDSNHFRHMPIVDDQDRVTGILSIRHLLHRMVEDLSQELHALDSYVSADGIGG